jgi:hypothetical protein
VTVLAKINGTKGHLVDEVAAAASMMIVRVLALVLPHVSVAT